MNWIPNAKLLSDGWDLATKDLRTYFRDRVGLALGFIMPIALVTVFGVVMAYAFGASGGTPKISMMLTDLDNTDASQELVQGLRKSDMLKISYVTSDKTDAKEYIRGEIADGDAHHGLIIEAGYSEDLDAGKVPTLTLLRDPGRSMEQQIIQVALMQEMISLGNPDLLFSAVGNLFQKNGLGDQQWTDIRQRFVQTGEMIQGFIDDGSLDFDDDGTGTDQSSNASEEGDPSTNSDEEKPDAVPSADSDAKSKESNDASQVNQTDADDNSKANDGSTNPMEMMADLLPIETVDVKPPDRAARVTYQQAQTVSGVSVMMLLFGLVGAGSVLLREREEGTLRRLLSLPIRRESILAGKFFYVAVVGILQMVVLMVYGELLFRVGLFESPLTATVVVITWVAVGSTFALLIATACQSSKQADGLSSILILVMSALGGCWFPVQLMNFPDWLDAITKAMPTYWAMTCFQGMLWNKLSVADPKMLMGLGIQWAYVLIMGGISLFLYQRNYCRDQAG